jgi:hypothetical protein
MIDLKLKCCRMLQLCGEIYKLYYEMNLNENKINPADAM